MIKRGSKKYLPLKRKLRTDMTPTENKIWIRLKNKQLEGLKFRRQHGIGPYIVDFYCPEKKIVVEIDGDTHAEEGQIAKDQEREEYLQKLGVKIIRYFNNDVLKNINGVMEDLFEKISV